MALEIVLPIGSGLRRICFFDEVVQGYVTCSDPTTQYSLISIDVSILPADHVTTYRRDHDANAHFSIYDTIVSEMTTYNGIAAWKFEFIVAYPRMKFDNPQVLILATANLPPVPEPARTNLANFEPRRRNLFSELNHQLLASHHYQFSGELDLVKKARPTPLRTVLKSVPVEVLLALKLKTIKAAGRNLEVLAALTLLLLLTDYEIDILDMSVAFKYGLVVPVMPPSFPCRFDSRDFRNFTYKIITEEIDMRYVTIHLTLRVYHYGTPVSQEVYTVWTPNIDFGMLAPPINPLLKTGKKIRKKSSMVTVNLSTNNMTGLRLTFKGRLSISLGEVVTWRLQAINTGSNRMSLVVKSTEFDGVFVLDNGLRIPLDANSVFETDIKIFGVSRGIHTLEGTKIFDVASGEGLDFGKLVEVFVI